MHFFSSKSNRDHEIMPNTKFWHNFPFSLFFFNFYPFIGCNYKRKEIEEGNTWIIGTTHPSTLSLSPLLSLLSYPETK